MNNIRPFTRPQENFDPVLSAIAMLIHTGGYTPDVISEAVCRFYEALEECDE